MDTMTISLLVLLLMAVAAGLVLSVRHRYTALIFPTVLMIFFPAPNLQLFGRDALTTGTMLIFFMFACYLVVGVQEGRLLKDTYDGMIWLLLLCGLISTIAGLKGGYVRGDDVGPAVRQYVTFISALGFFLILKNSRTAEHFPEKMLNWFLVLISVHVIISLAIRRFPGLDAYLQVFYAREQESMYVHGSIERGRSILFSPEQFGEILGAMSPLVTYRALKEKRVLWYACLGLFAIGLVLSATRSGIVLAVLGVSLVLAYHIREHFMKVAALAGSGLIVLLVVVFYAPDLLGDVYERFTMAKGAYASGGNLSTTINRDDFPQIWQEVMRSLSPFGHSLLRVDYHNLLFTTFQQMGYIGSLLFFWVLLYPGVLLFRAYFYGSRRNRGLIFSCLLALGLFLVNEMKFEFTRVTGYQQVWWALLALFYLIARTSLLQRNESHG